MNRKDRRKNGVKQPAPKMKHLPEAVYREELNMAYLKGYNYAFEKASNLAVMYMFAVPLLVLNESFGEIRLKEFEGKSRIEHFFDLCVDKFDNYNDGKNVIETLMKDVEEQTGFNLSERVVENG